MLLTTVGQRCANVSMLSGIDHMLISGTDPSSVILNETKEFQNLKSYARKIAERS